jgi:hypothetical protein
MEKGDFPDANMMHTQNFGSRIDFEVVKWI